MNKMSKSEAGTLGAIASRATRIQRMLDREQEYLKNPCICLTCNKVIPYDTIRKRKKNQRKFCSRSCAAKTTNTSCPKRTKINGKCKSCGKDTIRYNLYCSNNCLRDTYSARRYKIYQESGFASLGFLKRFLIKQNGNRCMMDNCGWDWSKPCTIELDHIDGNSQNNKLENLRLICPNCHTQTSTYKGKNLGNGRHKRRERYQQGKSY